MARFKNWKRDAGKPPRSETSLKGTEGRLWIFRRKYNFRDVRPLRSECTERQRLMKIIMEPIYCEMKQWRPPEACGIARIPALFRLDLTFPRWAKAKITQRPFKVARFSGCFVYFFASFGLCCVGAASQRAKLHRGARKESPHCNNTFILWPHT